MAPKSKSGAAAGKRRLKRSSQPVVDSIVRSDADPLAKKRARKQQNGPVGGVFASLEKTSTTMPGSADNHNESQTGQDMRSLNAHTTLPTSANSINDSRASSKNTFNLSTALQSTDPICNVSAMEGTGNNLTESYSRTLVPPLNLTSADVPPPASDRLTSVPTTATAIINSSEPWNYTTQVNEPLSENIEHVIAKEVGKQVKLLEVIVTNGFKGLERGLSDVRKEIDCLKTSLAGVKESFSETELKTSKSKKVCDPSKSIDSFSKLFNKAVVLLSLESCVMMMTMKIVMSKNSDESFLEKVSLSIQAMMFSVLPGDCKTKFETRIGMQHCALRRALVRTALCTVQQDIFSRFH